MGTSTRQKQEESSRLWYWSIPLFIVIEVARRLGYMSYVTIGLIFLIVIVILAKVIRSAVQKHKARAEKELESKPPRGKKVMSNLYEADDNEGSGVIM